MGKRLGEYGEDLELQTCEASGASGLVISFPLVLVSLQKGKLQARPHFVSTTVRGPTLRPSPERGP